MFNVLAEPQGLQDLKFPDQESNPHVLWSHFMSGMWGIQREV